MEHSEFNKKSPSARNPSGAQPDDEKLSPVLAEVQVVGASYADDELSEDEAEAFFFV